MKCVVSRGDDCLIVRAVRNSWVLRPHEAEVPPDITEFSTIKTNSRIIIPPKHKLYKRLEKLTPNTSQEISCMDRIGKQLATQVNLAIKEYAKQMKVAGSVYPTPSIYIRQSFFKHLKRGSHET